MKKGAQFLIVLFPLLAGCVSASKYDELKSEFSHLETLTRSQENVIAELEFQITDLENDLSESEALNAVRQEEIVSLTNDIEDLAETITTLREDKNLIRSDADAEIRRLEMKFLCSDHPIDVDYKNNYTVSKSLVKYVESSKSIADPISANYWKLFWTLDKHSLHSIEVFSESDNVNYLWEFIVYFRGESHGQHTNGVFWSGQGCWLNYEE